MHKNSRRSMLQDEQLFPSEDQVGIKHLQSASDFSMGEFSFCVLLFDSTQPHVLIKNGL